MYIGEIAKRTGATPKAIRHYEALGLLGVVRRAGAYRVYLERDVLSVTLIKQAQALGFKLSELRFIGADYDNPDWTQLLHLIADKRRGIASEILRLQKIDILLAAVSDEIRACPESHDPRNPTLASCK